MSLNTALISVDVAAFRLHKGQLQVLVRQQDVRPDTQGLVLPAGRIDQNCDDSLDDTARRVLGKLTVEPASYYEQVRTIGNADRDSRGWSLTVVYYALLNRSEQQLQDDACWISIINGKPEQSLAYDHEKLVIEALCRLKNKIQYSSLPVYLLPEEFTLSDIQKVFASILEKAPPMRSIRNRFLQGELLEETGHLRRGSCRPAALYRINRQSNTLLFDRLYLSTQT